MSDLRFKRGFSLLEHFKGGLRCSHLPLIQSSTETIYERRIFCGRDF
jgi:hypothetical protein